MHRDPQPSRDVPHIVDRTGNRLLSPATAGFEELVDTYAFVDKTAALGDICRSGGSTALCRPPGFGKTCLLDMLKCYLELPVEGWVPDRDGLFAGLAIEGAGDWVRREQRSHPVIHLRLGNCGHESYKKTQKHIAREVAREYRRHAYLLGSPRLLSFLRPRFRRLAAGKPERELDLLSSLDWLSTLLARHHGTDTVILIDDYDAPIADGCLHGYRKEISDFYFQWLHDAIKATDDLFLAVLTGTFFVPEAWVVRALDATDTATMLDRAYADALGLTEDELLALAAHVGQAGAIDGIHALHGGIRSGNATLCNTREALTCLATGTTRPHQVDDATDVTHVLVRQTLSHASEKTLHVLAALSRGEEVSHSLDMRAALDDLGKDWVSCGSALALLFMVGIITTDDTGRANDDRSARRLRLPNLAAKELLRQELDARAREVRRHR